MRSELSPPVARPLNPPSIPSHNNVFGYEETQEKVLVKQNNPETVFAGEKHDTVGPGHYLLSEQHAKKGKGYDWHTSRVPVSYTHLTLPTNREV